MQKFEERQKFFMSKLTHKSIFNIFQHKLFYQLNHKYLLNKTDNYKILI